MELIVSHNACGRNPSSARLVRSSSALVLGAILAVIASGCGKAHDAATSEVAGSRLVSVAPALTAIVVELGAADALVGVTKHCAIPSTVAVKPAIIGDFRPIPERVLATRPTQVLMATYASQDAERQGLEALGLPVITFELLTLSDLRQTITRLGALLAREARAEALNAALDRATQDLRACFGPADTAARPTYALIYGTDPGFVYTTGGGDHLSELLDLTGAKNALASFPRTARVGLERVLAAKPDLIIHVAPTDGMADSAAAKAFWGSWPEVPAVRHGSIVVWPDDRLARNGAHLAALAPELCALVRAAAPAVGTPR